MKTLSSILWICSLWMLARAGVNRTIDDTYGDSVDRRVPTYTGSWIRGQECGDVCLIKPKDMDRVHSSTWSDSTQFVGKKPNVVEISFSGSAVYVYGILVGTHQSGWSDETYLRVSINSTIVGEFEHIPDDGSVDDPFLYGVPLYVNRSLPFGRHTLEITTTANEKQKDSLFLFDYVEYTYEDTPASASESTSKSAIASTASPSKSTTTSTTSTSHFPTASMTLTSKSATVSTVSSITISQSATPTPSSASKTSVAAMSGGVTGGIIVAALILWVL